MIHEHQKKTNMSVSKTLMLTAIIVTGVFSSFTQPPDFGGRKSLPKIIAPSFSAKYPEAKLKNWEMLNDEYVVRYINEKSKCTAFFSSGGQWIRTETSIPWTKDLPQAVRTGIQNSGYGTCYVDAIRKVQTAGRLLYVLHVDDGSTLDADHYDAFREDWLLSFTPDGVLAGKSRYRS